MPRRHAVLALVVAVCWGANFVVIDVGLESLPPLLFAALRFALIAFPAALVVPRPDVRWRAVVVVGLLVCVGQFGLLFVAMNMGVPPGLASVILPLQPVFTISFARVALGERPTRAQLAGVFLSLVGLGVIAAGRAHGVPLAGVVLCVAAAASWGAANVVTRGVKTRRPFSLLVWSSLVGPLSLALLSFAFERARWSGAFADLSRASALLALAYVVVVATFFGLGVWLWLLSQHPAATVAPFTLLVPVVGIATAWLARGERPTPGELGGSLIVLAGLGFAAGVAGRRAGRKVRASTLRRLIHHVE